MKPIKIKYLGSQKTIKSAFSMEGVVRNKEGVISKLTAKSSPSGVVFKVIDKEYKVKLTPQSVIDSRGIHTTILENSEGQRVYTVEHLLSALNGMGVDSVLIELKGSNEVPIFSHSAREFAECIARVGTKRLGAKRKAVVIKRDIFFEHNGSLAILRSSEKRILSVLIQFDHPIGEQFFSVDLNKNTYLNEISWARSFIRTSCDDSHWKQCRRQIPSLPEKREESPIPVFVNGKWIVKVKRKNEPVRHKTLDVIGDLFPLGYPIVGHLTLVRPGHDFNRRLVNYLWSMINK